MKGNFNSLMAQAAKMQQNIQRLQSELGKIVVTGEAGGGLVKVTMTCKYDCRQIQIDPSLYEEDRDMIEDLVTAAVNSALKAVEATTQERMRQATAGMPLPPGMRF
ncbi:YbaB/EbfC family nucleoid-associated protein [Mesosutterella sp. OilRF-GAM-744-9]|uniref:Nucleoid-associated protein MAF45_09175 n=2 Tax=Mesosutterella TaxID=2494213 RepID=A0ABS9MTF8_9BURK|nr:MULTISPECIES: YbaB/EbfC family nucleoid-associated protein [unclassified Mesosutterella]MCG5031609.1 YbaB/EbfC family nucleoid-associated protein [Mesosutterella sp. oilRF-744-WT-GAM-9]MCI6530078.1 YbaB/EbfC family nucleoid-associated protein [Mesosutterella sp.]MDL2059139.1 YbaB/EbfC family nucleoid-associated protein [Mesosutterella sp. AGMB02718]